MKRLFRKLKRLFYKIKRNVTPAKSYASHGEGAEKFKAAWGIIIPHTKYAQGAASHDRKYSEYTYGLAMADIIGLPNAKRDEAGVFGAARKLVGIGVNATIEPHFNAYNGHAHGAEILVLKGDKLSEHFARLYVEDFAMKYKRRLRHDNGIKFVSKGDRGYANLAAAKDAGAEVAILSELFFGDNPVDYIDYHEQARFWENTLVPIAHKPI